MIQKNQTRKTFQISKSFGLTLVLISSLAILGIVIWAGWLTTTVSYVNDQVQVQQAREPILETVKLSKIPVPVEAKTGDFYFAELKLLLPAKDEDLRLTYGHLPSVASDYGKYDVSVSNDFVFAHAANGVYEAQDIDSLYKATPLLYACQRGVRIIEKLTPAVEQNTALVLSATIDVGVGRTVYLFSDKQCPQLEEVVHQLKDLRAY